MRDESNVGCVNAHAKGAGACQHLEFAFLPSALEPVFGSSGQARMKPFSSHACLLEPCSPALGFVARTYINQAFAWLRFNPSKELHVAVAPV